MSASGIRSRISKGLSRAAQRTGSNSSDDVYAVIVTKSGGSGTPINPSTETKVNVLLKDAIFTQYDRTSIDGNILAGDRKLVSQSDVEIKIGMTILQGNKSYVVIDVDIKAPTSDVLAYISQVREQ